MQKLVRLLRSVCDAVLYCCHCGRDTNHTFMSGHYVCDVCGHFHQY